MGLRIIVGIGIVSVLLVGLLAWRADAVNPNPRMGKKLKSCC